MNDYDISPRGVYRETGRWAPPAVFVIAVILVIAGAVTLVCWRAGWWFASQNATRQYQVIQNGDSNQSTLRTQVTEKLGEVATVTTQIAAASGDLTEIAALKPQRAAIAGIVCSDAAQITTIPLPSQQAQWVSLNCSDGNVSPSSNLYVVGAP